MTVSKVRLVAYAKQVLEPELKEAVEKLVAEDMLRRFRNGTPEEREIINAIMDNDIAFHQVLVDIVADDDEAKERKQQEKEERDAEKAKKPRGRWSWIQY